MISIPLFSASQIFVDVFYWSLFAHLAFGSSTGESVADSFVKHLAANAPVAGLFEVRHSTEDLEELRRQEEQVSQNYAAQNRKVRFGPSNNVRLFDWAWDGSYEKCQSLAGSTVFETFFRSPEAYLDMVGEANYNLNKPERPTYYRPASFYFLAGITPWQEVFSGAELTTTAAPEDSPPGRVCLVASLKGGVGQWRLILDAKRFVLYGYNYHSRGTLLLNVTVDKFASGPDNRLFPSHGRLVVHDMKSGRPQFSEELRMQSISFPADKRAVRDTFKTVLPAKTRIADRVMNRLIVLDKPTSVAEVISGNLASIPMRGAPIDIGPPPPVPRTRFSLFFLFNAIALSLIAVYALWRIIRRRRSLNA